MLKIGKLAQQAIAAASYLAERYDDQGGSRISAAEIADARELPRPVVAKLLATLSQHGITTGITGPSGGYQLARAPEEISLYDIVSAFESMETRPMCPFGPNWCGHGAPCPLHEAIASACEQGDQFFKSHHLGPFRLTKGKTENRKR